MHGHAGRLVDHEQALVFIDHPAQHVRSLFFRRGRPLRPDPDRRDTDLVALLQFVFGPNPTPVHPHFAAAQQTVDPSLGDARQFGTQKVIDTLPGALGIDAHFANPGDLRLPLGT